MWQCLRVQAAARLTARQASQHDWLNSSAAHVKFFEKFDQRVLANWTDRAELNALPLELPCVLSRLESPAADTGDGDRSSYFTPKGPESITVAQHCDNSPVTEIEPGSNTASFTFQKPPLPVQITPKPTSKPQSPPKATSKTVLKYGERARRRQSKRKRLSELNLRPDLKIHENMHLPLNNLDRHLPPTPNTKKRKHVLEELRQSKAMFLEQ